MSGLSGMLFSARRGRLLKTGQVTQYNSELDDGYWQKGRTKAYTVLSTGGYSGTSNIDLAHYTSGAGTITFDNTLKTIVDTGAGLAIFKTNDVITTDSVNNPGPFTITTGNVAGTITCTGATFVDETPAGTVTISKREAHSNNCVLDLNTGLMWSRYVADKVGPDSDGGMVATGQPYDQYAYAAAANTASLGGYTDWRIPNINELQSIADWEAPTGLPDATAFPSFPSTGLWWSSTTRPDGTANGILSAFDTGYTSSAAKTTQNRYVMLVRGG